MRTSPAGSEAGFTLTELLVVLAIMALVVSVTPALYRVAIPGARLKSASIALLTYLRDARQTATRTGEPLVLEVSGGVIRPKGSGGTPFEAPAESELAYKPAYGEGRDDLVFFPDGGSTGGTVTLTHGSAARSLSISWLTGHVSIGP